MNEQSADKTNRTIERDRLRALSAVKWFSREEQEMLVTLRNEAQVQARQFKQD